MVFSDVDKVVGLSQVGEVAMVEGLHGVSTRSCLENAASGVSKKVKEKEHKFKLPEQDKDINYISKKRFAPQSHKKMMWAVNV